MTFAPILTTFSRSVVRDQRSTSSGRTSVRKKWARLGRVGRAPRRTHASPPSRLFAASRRTCSPSLLRAASKPKSRHDSGRGKLVLECSFANSPRSTKVGFWRVLLGELAAEGPPLLFASGELQKGRGHVVGGDTGSGRCP